MSISCSQFNKRGKLFICTVDKDFLSSFGVSVFSKTAVNLSMGSNSRRKSLWNGRNAGSWENHHHHEKSWLWWDDRVQNAESWENHHHHEKSWSWWDDRGQNQEWEWPSWTVYRCRQSPNPPSHLARGRATKSQLYARSVQWWSWWWQLLSPWQQWWTWSPL